MRIISFVTLPSTVERTILHLDLAHRPPRISSARGPPQAEFNFDRSPAFDLAAPEPIPEFEFDRSPSHDWAARLLAGFVRSPSADESFVQE